MIREIMSFCTVRDLENVRTACKDTFREANRLAEAMIPKLMFELRRQAAAENHWSNAWQKTIEWVERGLEEASSSSPWMRCVYATHGSCTNCNPFTRSSRCCRGYNAIMVKKLSIISK